MVSLFHDIFGSISSLQEFSTDYIEDKAALDCFVNKYESLQVVIEWRESHGILLLPWNRVSGVLLEGGGLPQAKNMAQGSAY